MLLDEFSVIFDRPEKIKKLREYILQLAVRGKLVAQDEDDEPASVLLGRIREEKDRLVKEKKIKKEKLLPEISKDEIPYELPKGWEWVRLGEVCKSIGGNGFPVKYQGLDKGRIPFFKVSDLSNESNSDYVINSKNWIEDDEVINKFTLIDKYSVVFPKIGGALLTNNRKILGIAGFIDNNCMALTCWNQSMYKYIFLFMKTIDLGEFCKGTSVPSISQSFINNLLIPIAPLNEQKKIVEKVDYLMDICDKLEANLEKKIKYGSLSAKSILNNVSNCSSYEELENSLRFIIDNFKDLALSDGAIKELKNAILSLVVRGKLIQQDENDEPASILIEKIKEEKDRLVKEKKIKKEKPLSEITEDEIPYEVPKSWEWVRLAEICSLITDGTHSTPKYTDKGIPFLSVKDLSKGIIDFSNTRFISEEEHNTLIKRCKPQYGDILLTKVGTTGIAKYVDTNKEFSIFVSVALLKIFKEYINPIFLEKTINSPIVRKQSDENTQGVGNKNLVLKCIKNFVIPLPPLNEQKRIVEKLDKLMKICDELELRIEESNEYSKKLMNSLLK